VNQVERLCLSLTFWCLRSPLPLHGRGTCLGVFCRRHADEAAGRAYDPASIGCVLLYTSHATMLDDLSRPLDERDVLSNANTLIYMGKIREGDRITRGLYIAKHRGSACGERIVPYPIDDGGVRLD
jgi:hypothetical protein